MSVFNKFGKPFLAILLFLSLMTAGSIYLYKEYQKTNIKIHSIIHNDLVSKKITLIKNFISQMEKELDNNASKQLEVSPVLRTLYEDRLRALLTSEIKFLYILSYKNSADGIQLNYLLDTTLNDEDRALFNQPFEPQSDSWENVFLSQKESVKQQPFDTLWISMVIPIIENGEVVAAIGLDLDNEEQTHIDEVLEPLDKLYFYISIFMVLMLLSAYIQVGIYYYTRKHSFIDPLTKVFNRQYLSSFLKSINIKDYQILMIDIDHFKNVNDTYGHDIGDIILNTVSSRISSLIREKDSLIRYGGEEFVLFLYKQSLPQAKSVAERILNVFRDNPIQAKQNSIDLTLSIGINPYPSHFKDIQEAIKISDEQLYLAKSNGRNRIESYDLSEDNHANKTQHINDIKMAIEESRIRCMYQPIFTTNTNTIEKYEVLIRMIDNDNNIILPNDFLPFISHTQLYTDLTKFVIESSLKRLEETDAELSINLELQDLFNNDILEIIIHILNTNQKYAKKLTFEILETQEVSNLELLKEKINKIRQTGAKIALDDFGSGYANFTYLLHLDIDILKIDGTLIRDIHKNSNAKNIVETINIFAQKMNIKTVAEQIETKEEYETIKSIGIDYMQGYYLGRPSFEFVD